MIKSKVRTLTPEDLVNRVKSFVEHLHREDHFDNAKHQKELESLERRFHRNNFDDDDREVHMSVRPASLEATENEEGEKSVEEDAQRFTKEYEKDCQFIFSHCQHHWHKLGEDGKRYPMRYCQSKRRGKSGCCKGGFPKKVLRDNATGKIRKSRYRVRIVCEGVAKELDISTKGRRNMLGALVGRRQCGWFSGT